MTIAFLFVLLFVFMLVGMPIAIALGLSSLLTILFLGHDSLASLALKLFETSEALHPAGDSVLHPVRRLHDHGRRRQAHGRLRQCQHRPPARRPGDGIGAGLHALRRGLGLVAGDGGRGRLDRDRRHGQGRVHEGVRRRRHLQCRHARHPHPAFHRDGGLCGRHRDLGRQAVHGRRHPRHRARTDADGGDLVSRPRAEDSPASRGRPGARSCAPGAIPSGACCCW